jgi:hypothetical protein
MTLKVERLTSEWACSDFTAVTDPLSITVMTAIVSENLPA